MFTIKVTYHGQTRKHTFHELNSLPSYWDICTQTQRLFLISNSFYLSNLLFFSVASSPARILLGKEVHTASEYLQCTRPFKDRKWEHGLLKFTVYDIVDSILPSFDTSGISSNSKESLTRASSGSVRSSMSQFVPPFAPMDVDQPTSHTLFERNTTQHPLPSLRHCSSAQSLTSCCSVAQGKAEIKALLTDFQDGLNRVLENDLQQPLSISRKAAVETLTTSETLKANVNVLPTRLPSWCSHCTRDITACQNGGYIWYSCADCRVVVCKICHEKGKPGFCFNAMGPHSMQLMTDISSDFTAPPAAVPWASFCSSNAPFTSTPVAMPPPLPDFCYPEYSASTSGTTQAQPVKQPVVHTGVICNTCYRTITGVRHKCLDCKDYDLCSLCIGAGYAETHNPFHEFLEIHEPGRVIVHTVSSNNDEQAAFNRPRHESQSGPPPRHTASCDLCDSKIFGDRYKCSVCPDYDTCASCFSITDIQHPNHSFVRLTRCEDYIRVRSTPQPMHYATCNSCNKTICGIRFKCMHAECPDYDLCQNCEALPIAVHPPNHPMLKMKTPNTVVPIVYRLGQRNFNQERNTTNAVSEQKTCSSVEIPVTACVSPVHSPARVETPTPSSVRNVVTSQSSSASADNVTFPTSLNPFADIFAADNMPGFSHGAPSVTPWPTIDHSERDELFQRFVDCSVPYASDVVVNCEKQSVHEDKVEKDLVQMSEKSSLLDQLSRTPSQPSTPVIPAAKVAVTSGDASASLSRGSSLAECKEALEIDRVFDNFFAPTVPSASEGRSESPPVADESNGQSAKQPVKKDSEKYEGDSSPGNSNLQLFSVHEAIANLIRELPLLVPGPAPILAKAEINPSRAPLPAPLPLSAMFIEDVTVPDGQVFPPGAEFVKCWRLVNDREREWPESTELVFLAGDTLSAAKADALAEDKSVVVAVGKTAPGQIVDIWTGELKAPETPGRYVGYWRLKADGVLFGNSLWIEINVAEADFSDESMAASSVIMPTASSAPQSERVPSVTVATLSTHSRSVASMTEDNLSDAGSDVSLVSMPSSADDDEDAWHEARSRLSSNLSPAAAGSPPTTAAMDYVLLYDDESSDEERK